MSVVIGVETEAGEPASMGRNSPGAIQNADGLSGESPTGEGMRLV